MRVAVGILGGTFDPIHRGHLEAAASVADQLGLSTILLVPTGDPWQKTTHASREDRLAMTSLAAAESDVFTVSRVDIDRPGPTYTLDTLRDLREQYSEAELFFIVGADALAGLPSWRSPEFLAEMATFVGVTRPGERFIDPDIAGLQVVRVDVPAVDVSSTQIRSRVAEGEPIDDLVPESVADYISSHRLYRESE
jgi:nicotinate-nucleotide adenylyltransferase